MRCFKSYWKTHLNNNQKQQQKYTIFKPHWRNKENLRIYTHASAIRKCQQYKVIMFLKIYISAGDLLPKTQIYDFILRFLRCKNL